MRRKLNVDPIRLWARDRRMAALHEAGHIVIAKRFRISVGPAYLYVPQREEFDRRYQRTWSGRSHLALQAANENQRRMIGVAGAVAELCWTTEPVDEEFWFSPNMMSESDWRTAQCEPGNPDDKCIEAIASVAALLERGASHWPDLLVEARKLITASQAIL